MDPIVIPSFPALAAALPVSTGIVTISRKRMARLRLF
jgi:hypothetical protein